MKLNFIKAGDSCPSCGADLIGQNIESCDGKIREHTNGGRWESKTYACGCVISYVPNFNCDELTRICPNTPIYIAIEERRRIAKEKLQKYIDKLDVDNSYKEQLKFKIL